MVVGGCFASVRHCAVYNLLNIRHSTVADFDGVAVEDLSERVVCCEYIVNYLKKLSAYVCRNSFIKRWVVPSYVSLPFHSSVVVYAVCLSVLNARNKTLAYYINVKKRD